MSGNFAIKGGGVGHLMANAILNFHFDFLHPSLSRFPDLNCFFHFIFLSSIFFRNLAKVSSCKIET